MAHRAAQSGTEPAGERAKEKPGLFRPGNDKRRAWRNHFDT